MDLLADPDLADTMLADAEAFALTLSRTACDRFPLDWLWTGDDVGGQLSMMMSPACWRERIAPRLARIIEVGKSRGLWTAYHSCGAIGPIIPDLIDMGLDVLNPIQSNCPGMDADVLKREYGKDLAFMGGVDTQGVLPNGSVGDVRRETERLLETMTQDGGGYILAASHTIPPEAPMENIFAVYEAAGITQEEINDRAAAARKAVDRAGESD
jgi:uroporphyrinogen decarboxylase